MRILRVATPTVPLIARLDPLVAAGEPRGTPARVYDSANASLERPAPDVPSPVTWRGELPAAAPVSCRPTGRVARWAPVTVLLVLATAASALASPRLAPHEAHYALALHASSRGSEVAALRGRMKMRFEQSCDGWRMEQALAFRMLAQEGAGLEHLAHFNAFEEADGTGFIFNARTWEDRELVEELSGRARRRTDGRAEVVYVRPEARSEVLPEGTMFPSAHLRSILAAARAGRRFTMSTVFDGSSTDSPFQISTVIGLPVTQPRESPAALSGSEAWPVRLAYFAPDAVEPGAEFEMSVTLFANGVAGNMVYDYGDFAIDVRLTDVELLASPRCDR